MKSNPDLQNRPFRTLSFSCAIIAALGILIYGNHLHNPFQFDSVYYITTKQGLEHPEQMLSLEHWKKEYFSRGLLQVSLALNAVLDGQNPFGYHLASLLLHILNGILVFFVTAQALRYFGNARSGFIDPGAGAVSLFTALLFLCHPIQTESVVYIMSRGGVLAATFYLGAFLIFQKVLNTPVKRRTRLRLMLSFAAVAFLIFLGFSAKQTLATLPLVLVVYYLSGCDLESVPKQFLIRRKWWIVSAAVITGILLMQKLLTDEMFLIGPTDPSEIMGRKFYMLSQPWVLVFYYFKLLLFPINFNIDPDIEVVTGIFSWRFLPAFLMIVSLVYYSTRIKTNRIFLFSILWFFIVVSPSSSIVTLQDLAAEHRVYLASWGFYLVPAMVLYRGVLWAYEKGTTVQGKGTIASGVLIVAALCLMTMNRNLDWKSELALWQDAGKKSPNLTRPIINLARAHSLAGDIDQAVHYYEEALKRRPDVFVTHYNLGELLMKQGRVEEAVTLLEKAKGLEPSIAEAPGKLGEIYLNLGRYELAEQNLKKAIELNPNYAVAMRNLGVVNYFHRNRKEEGLLYFARALTLDPGQPEADKIRRLLDQNGQPSR